MSSEDRPPARGGDPESPWGVRDPAARERSDDEWWAARDAAWQADRVDDDHLPHHPVRERKGILRTIGGGIVAVGLLLAKFLGPVVAVLSKLKFVTSGLSFLVSVAAYATIWGWRFALGFTILLFVHEMGHVLQLRHEGVKATAPLFIPFLGAVVGMKELPPNGWVEAKVGLAGPVLGTVGAGATFALAAYADSELLHALAYTAFFLNLINLLPIVPLDGGRAAAVFHPAVWFVGLFLVAGLYFLHPNLIVLFILLIGGYELYRRWTGRNTAEARAYRSATPGQRAAVAATYLALVVVLVLGMDASYIDRDF